MGRRKKMKYEHWKSGHATTDIANHRFLRRNAFSTLELSSLSTERWPRTFAVDCQQNLSQNLLVCLKIKILLAVIFRFSQKNFFWDVGPN